MTRVSSFGHQQVMLSGLLKNQEKVFNGQLTINTGKKELEYKGFATELNTLLGAKNALTRTQGFIGSAEYVQRQLDTNDVQLNALVDNANNVREAVLNAIAMDETFALSETLGEAFSSMVSALNTNIGGVHIFSGARTDVPPVNGSENWRTWWRLRLLPTCSRMTPAFPRPRSARIQTSSMASWRRMWPGISLQP